MAQKELRKSKKKGSPFEIYGKERQIWGKAAKWNTPFIYCNLFKVDFMSKYQPSTL